jgi:hypothetical protein
MDIAHLVKTDYQEAVRMLPSVDAELKRSLKSHERVPKFLENLSREISRLPNHLRPDRARIKKIVYDMTELFVHNVKRQADEMAMSDARKQAEIAAAQAKKDLDMTANGTPVGDYAEVLKDVQDGSKEV